MKRKWNKRIVKKTQTRIWWRMWNEDGHLKKWRSEDYKASLKKIREEIGDVARTMSKWWNCKVLEQSCKA